MATGSNQRRGSVEVYLALVEAAVVAQRRRDGSTLSDIKRFIERESSVEFAPHLQRAALKRGVATRRLRVVGASRYKISQSSCAEAAAGRESPSSVTDVPSQPAQAPAREQSDTEPCTPANAQLEQTNGR